MNSDYEIFANNLKFYMNKYGYNQSTLAEKLGGNETMNAIPGFSLYAFRHLRATELLYRTQSKDHPISILQAAELMGHSVNVFLNTYSHIQKQNEGLDHIYDSVSSL